MDTIDVAVICKALGDSNRLQIIQMLSDGEKCGCKLLEAFNITATSIVSIFNTSYRYLSMYYYINHIDNCQCIYKKYSLV